MSREPIKPTPEELAHFFESLIRAGESPKQIAEDWRRAEFETDELTRGDQ